MHISFVETDCVVLQSESDHLAVNALDVKLPEDLSVKIANLFMLIDTDSNGEITRQEMRAQHNGEFSI